MAETFYTIWQSIVNGFALVKSLFVWSIEAESHWFGWQKSAKNRNDQLQSSNESVTIGTIEDYESTEKMIVSSPLKVLLIPNS